MAHLGDRPPTETVDNFDDDSGDLAHEEVMAEMWARGMITPESESCAATLTHEDFVRAQEEYEREQQEQK